MEKAVEGTPDAQWPAACRAGTICAGLLGGQVLPGDGDGRFIAERLQ
ncbi:hypothetical protein OG552_36245 [Streptomyces sp. NBC_01476]|nr:hypothetical protein [Streptomyces sp. NBC_01476]